MPRFNSRGSALWGVGGGGGRMLVLLSTDASGNVIDIGQDIRAAICAKLGIAISGEGAGAFWKDDRTLAVQFCGDPTERGWGYNGCSTWLWDVESKTLSGPFGPGANKGAGRGGTAAWWLGNYKQIAKYQGVYTTDGYNNATAGLCDVYGNGDVLIVNDYQQATLGLSRIRGTSIVESIPTIGQVQGVVARGNIAVWLDFGDRQLHAKGAPNPVTVPNRADHAGPFASDKNGRLWMIDGQNGLMLRAWDVPVGRWLSRDGQDYWGDIIAMPGGKFRVGSSMNQGETEGAQRLWDIDPLTGDYTFNGRAGNAPLVSLLDDSPAVLPAPPAAPISTAVSGGGGGGGDTDNLIAIAIALAVFAGLWYYFRK